MPRDSKRQVFLRWQAPEYHPTERHPDWQWYVGLIAFVLIIISIIFKNFLFALIVLLGAYSLVALERKEPTWPEIEISTDGVRVGSNLYPFESVRSFWVEDNKDIDVLILHSSRPIFPYVHIYFYEMDPMKVKQVLKRYLPEVKPPETIMDKANDYFGF